MFVSKWTSQNTFLNREPPGCLLIPKVLLNLYDVTCTLPIWRFLLLFHLSFHIRKPGKKLSIWTKHNYICYVNTKHTNYQLLLMSTLNTLNQIIWATHCYILYVWGEVGHLFFLAFLAEYSHYFFNHDAVIHFWNDIWEKLWIYHNTKDHQC